MVQKICVRVRHSHLSTRRALHRLSNTPDEMAPCRRCRPLRGLCTVSCTQLLGFRFAPPQVLCCRPRRGLPIVVLTYVSLNPILRLRFATCQALCSRPLRSGYCPDPSQCRLVRATCEKLLHAFAASTTELQLYSILQNNYIVPAWSLL